VRWCSPASWATTWRSTCGNRARSCAGSSAGEPPRDVAEDRHGLGDLRGGDDDRSAAALAGGIAVLDQAAVRLGDHAPGDVAGGELEDVRARRFGPAGRVCFGPVHFHPDSAHARAAIGHLVRLQAAAGGNALIGRRLQPLLSDAGYDEVVVRPRTVYADQTRPALVEGFTRNTFTAMVEAVRDDAIAAGLTSPSEWDHGITDLYRTAEDGGTFHYTFFKGEAVESPLTRSIGINSVVSLRAIMFSLG
jgi:hypothetical protein